MNLCYSYKVLYICCVCMYLKHSKTVMMKLKNLMAIVKSGKLREERENIG